MGEQGVDQGSVEVAGGGVNDEAGGFVEHDQGIVFIEDVERDGLGLRAGRAGGGGIEHVAGAGGDRGGGVGGGAAGGGDVAGFDQRFDAGAREGGEGVGEKAVEPRGGVRGENLDRVGRWVGLKVGHGVGHGRGNSLLARAGLLLRQQVSGGQMRVLKAATIIMGVLIVGGTLLLAVLIMRRVTPGGATAAGTILLGEPAGSHLVGIASTAGGLAVAVQGGGADRILMLDPRTGRVTGRIVLGR
jgi:hypothetical protein